MRLLDQRRVLLRGPIHLGDRLDRKQQAALISLFQMAININHNVVCYILVSFPITLGTLFTLLRLIDT
jgi:hypothetical protein